MFDLSKLQFDFPPEITFEPPATDEMIEALERHYQHTLPEELKVIFKKYHGGCPETFLLEAQLPEDELPGEMEVSKFLILDSLTKDPLNIWFNIKNYSAYIGENSVPFAVDFADNVYYLKYSNNKHQVWYFALYAVDEIETYLIFESFDDFLQSLHAEEE